jgi:hypothetical protein
VKASVLVGGRRSVRSRRNAFAGEFGADNINILLGEFPVGLEKTSDEQWFYSRIVGGLRLGWTLAATSRSWTASPIMRFSSNSDTMSAMLVLL